MNDLASGRKACGLALALTLLGVAPAAAQRIGFSSSANGSLVHESGYVCPQMIGPFQRDAAGLRDPVSGAQSCSYSAQSGVYGTVILEPMTNSFDPKEGLIPAFRAEDAAGSIIVSEQIQPVGTEGIAVPVYVRVYRKARLDQREYRTLYAAAAYGIWAVEAIVEYSDPQDKDLNTAFLNAIYDTATKMIGAPAP